MSQGDLLSDACIDTRDVRLFPCYQFCKKFLQTKDVMPMFIANLTINHTLRKVLIAAISVFCASALVRGGAVGQAISPSANPTQLAAAIAYTMAATNPNSTGSAITQQFSSHKNIVESRMIIRDENNFMKLATRRHDLQMDLTRYLCKEERLVYIKRGVVFHYVTSGLKPDKSFEFWVDTPVCASLSKVATADRATLTTMAEGMAQQLTTDLSVDQSASYFRFEKAVALAGVVHITNMITVPAFANYFKFRAHEIRGKTQGSVCRKFGDEIRQGVRVDVLYELPDGSPVLEFPVDTSVC